MKKSNFLLFIVVYSVFMFLFMLVYCTTFVEYVGFIAETVATDLLCYLVYKKCKIGSK